MDVTGCESCPFNYDYYKCEHPNAEDANIIDTKSLPEECPLRKTEVLVKLKK